MENHSDRVRRKLLGNNDVSRRRVLSMQPEVKNQATSSEEEGIQRRKFDRLWFDEGVVD